MYSDIGVAWNNFDHTSAFFTTNFASDTTDTGADILAFKEILIGISSAVIILSILIGPEAAAAANVAGAIVNGINSALVAPTTDSLQTLAGVEA